MLSWRVMVLALLLALGVCPAFGQAETRTVQAVRTAQAPVIDGKLDDDCWKSATAMTGFLVTGTNRRAERQTFGYILYDNTRVYVGVKCLMPKGAKPVGQMRPHDSDIFNDDTVEVMIDPGRTGTDYYQLAINAYGATFDCARHQSGASEDDAWNGEWQGKSFIGDGFWSAEFAVPYYSLGIQPDVGTTWGLSMCRDAVGPREYSSIASHGAYNEANEFAVLEGLNVDFSNSTFGIGETVATFDPTSDRPRAVLSVSITNMTGKPRKVKILKELASTDGSITSETEVAEFAAKQSRQLRLESVDIESITSGTGVYLVKSEPKTKKIVVSDATTGATLAFAAVKKPPVCELMRLAVANPARIGKRVPATDKLSLTVKTFLPRDVLAKGNLIVTVRTRDTGRVVAEKQVSSPAEVEKVMIPAQSIDWGAYTVRSVFKDARGREIASAEALAPVFPDGKHSVKTLNTMVSELMNARDRKMLGAKSIEFMNPRDGWCFFSLSGSATISLDAEKKPLITTGAREKPAEAMRYLPAGRHTLFVSGKTSDLIVRAIPELQYASLNEHPICEAYGKYDWEFLKKTGILSNMNVFVTRLLRPEEEKPWMDEWVSRGKRLLYEVAVPGTYVGGDAKDSYSVWKNDPAMADSRICGLIGNEFYGHAGMVKNMPAWASAIGKLLDEKRDMYYYPYISFYGGPEPAMTLIAPLLAKDRFFLANERYLNEQPTEERARKVLKSWIPDYFRGFDAALPGSVQRTIYTMSLMTAPPETMDMDPTVNFKVFLDMQCRMLATDESCAGLRGVQIYYSRYADEEDLRWASKLYRHYFIEGKTEPLSSDPYNLSHIRNPDFRDGLQGWTVDAAEPDSIGTKIMEKYGFIQGRYPPPENGAGDCFMLMKRSGTKPNTVSQDIVNLEPGRAYSLKMYVADYPGLKSDQVFPISIKVDGAEMLQDRCLHGVFRASHHANYPLEKNYVNFIRLVFRATAKTGRLTISDWTSEGNPGEPAGQELMINFIEVEPYLMDN